MRNTLVGLVMAAATFALSNSVAAQGPNQPHAPESAGPKLSDLLAKTQKPVGPDTDSPYAAVPPPLEAAVRALAMDNFTSAAALLHAEKASASAAPDQARATMWLGLTYGLQAMSFPATAWQTATSATALLEEAIRLDPAIIDAPDVARIKAEMVANGWTSQDPAAALEQAEQKAEQTRRAADFYFAGVISRRLAAIAWAHSDTSEQDKKTLSLFAKAVARDPSRYESWSAYLPALLPIGMHDLATAEAKKMYQHFQNLRTPLLADQGPAVLMISNSSYRTVKHDEQVLAEVARRWPDAPMPRFELAMRAIETTVPLALELFPKLISDLETGALKPLPREAGYYPSALYKYAFLLQSVERRDEALAQYLKLKAISPDYAELNLNIAILLARNSETETSAPRKLELLEEAVKYAALQEKLDYRGKAAAKAAEMKKKLQTEIFKARQETAAAKN